MPQLCDLHTHSHFSDGSLSPAQLLEEAEGIGLGAIALTDHNTVAGLPEFLSAAHGRQIEAVPGIEFSTDYEGTELHILGLFIQPEHFDAITALMAAGARAKEESNLALIRNLDQAGYHLDYDRIRSASPNAQPNRAHIAAALTEAGYTASVQDAFRQLLSPKQGFYQPPERLGAFDCIRFIKSIGAVAVLAHPFLNLKTEAALTAFLEQAVPLGLDGMETLYPRFDAATTSLAKEIADRFGLRHSGGSDFHGRAKPDIVLGSGSGNLAVEMGLLEELKACLSKNYG